MEDTQEDEEISVTKPVVKIFGVTLTKIRRPEMPLKDILEL